MNFVLDRIVEPDVEPLSLAQAIQQVREFSSIGTAAQDQLTDLIVTAREWFEKQTALALVDQTWRLTLGDNLLTGSDVSGYQPQAFGTWTRSDSIYLRRTPVIALTKFVSVAADGTETAVETDAYSLLDAGSRWPRIVSTTGTWLDERLLIEYRAGYVDRIGSPTGSVTSIPKLATHAIRLYLEAQYSRDEKKMPLLIDAANCIANDMSAHIPLLEIRNLTD